MKVVVWFVGYSLKVRHLPADLPGAHKSGKQVAGGERKMVCLSLPMQPAVADRLAKVKKVQRGCAAGIAFTCMLLPKILKKKGEEGK